MAIRTIIFEGKRCIVLNRWVITSYISDDSYNQTRYCEILYNSRQIIVFSNINKVWKESARTRQDMDGDIFCEKIE